MYNTDMLSPGTGFLQQYVQMQIQTLQQIQTAPVKIITNQIFAYTIFVENIKFQVHNSKIITGERSSGCCDDMPLLKKHFITLCMCMRSRGYKVIEFVCRGAV